MADLLSLFSYKESQEEFLPYVIFQTKNPEAVQCLSPDIMKISHNLYVTDLTVVEHYWRHRAQREDRKLSETLEEVISKNLESSLQLFCEHPFQGLVFFNHLKVLDSQGCFRTDSLFAKKIYNNMGWAPWFLAARQVHGCFEENKCLKKERKSFSTHLNQMARFVERVDLQDFSSLKQAHFFEISRRFKSFCGLLWKWTFPKQNKKSEENQKSLLTFEHYEKLDGFPWIPFFEEEPPKVDNLLEYPVSEWEAMKDHLLYDLEKLSRLPSLQPPFKAMELDWQITLFDMSVVSQKMRFKTPLSFSEESENGFSTLIKQIQFSFENFQHELSQKNKELEIVNVPLIVGWSLEVSKRLILSEKNDLLDFDEQMRKVHKEELLSLTNKVKTGLRSYQTFENFIPGLDFTEKELSEEISLEKEVLFNLPRPFYLYPKEMAFSEEDIKTSQFLDRTSSDWWNRQDSMDSYRDCYLCELKSNEFVFAYRNYEGKWFRYGI